MIDLEPATSALARVIAGISDTDLGATTPCPGTTVGDLLDHVDNLSLAFTAAATKQPVPDQGDADDPGNGPRGSDGRRLGPDWRERLPRRLSGLAVAWRDPGAWQGMTEAGGITMPGEVAASVAIDEVIVHGWDLARSTGQHLATDPALIEAALGFVRGAVAQNPQGTPGLFGPPVAVPDDAPAFDRLIGLTGRDPGWEPKTVAG